MFKIAKSPFRDRWNVFERYNGGFIWHASFASAEAAFQWAASDYAQSLVADAQEATRLAISRP
jgi:hypothetical protein